MSTLPSLTGRRVGKYVVKEKLGEGGFGVTYKAIDTDVDAPVAIKFLKNIDRKVDWKSEARKAARVRDAPQIAAVYDVEESSVRLSNRSLKLKYIVWEFVKGITLEQFFQEKQALSSSTIVDLVEQICLGIAAMQEARLEHGDLHFGNIMLIPPKKFDPLQRYRIKILDFGLAKSFRGNMYRNDIDYLKDILLHCWDLNQYYAGEKLVADRKFHELVSTLIKQMEDTSPERRLTEPVDIINRIYDMKQQAISYPEIQDVRLRHPFEYLSVEEMPENSDLLTYLYTDNVPWLKEITGFGTTIISGPRGSGKSMILKNMRLLTKLKSKDFGEEQIKNQQFIGFYIHCQQNLYIPFAAHGIQLDDEKIMDLFLHYVNLLFTAEILETLIAMEERKFMEVSLKNKQAIWDFLADNILHDPGKIVLDSKSLLIHLKSLIEKEILLVQKKISRRRTVSKRTGVGYLNDLVRLLSHIDYFGNRQIYFLFDDYSQPKIDFNIQRSINRIIGYRNDRFCFKISTEKFGFIPEDLDGKPLQQDREFTYIDLGSRYLNYLKPERKEFIKEIIARRLQKANLQISPDEFFGKYELPHGNIARSLLYEKKANEAGVQYAGFNIIYRLCSGDVSTILQLCKELYLEAEALGADLRKGLDFALQDRVIKNFSKRRLDMLREIPTFGNNLYHLVEVFGNISKKYLYEYGEIAGKPDKYFEVIRLELTEATNCLTDTSHELFRRLMTDHIFIDAGGGYPWGKGISNLRLILRPIYTPALQISYNNRYAIKLSCTAFNEFLTRPDKFEKFGTKFLQKIAEGQIATSLDGYTATMGVDFGDSEDD